MATNNFIKAGRWTYAEQRQLVAGLRAGKTTEAMARDLRRSLSSAHRKTQELGLTNPFPEITRAQTHAMAEAERQRALAERCKELALLAGEKELENRLKAFAVEFHERAWAVEAKAGLPLTRAHL